MIKLYKITYLRGIMFYIKKFFLFTSLVLLLSACTGNQQNTSLNSEVLMGAGASFPHPFYSKLFEVYERKTDVKVNYQAIGSGGGIRQLFNNTVDFGATDSFIKDEKLSEFSHPVLHIPTCLGAVTISYNLGNDNRKYIVLSGDVLVDIFLGKIKYWDDPRILSQSGKNLDLPHLKITPVYRSDGSGTTAIFTDYLSKVSKEWRENVGTGKSVSWPVGVGAKGNAGVAGIVKQLPGSISYLNLSYAISNNLSISALKNKSGKIVLPDSVSTTLAAAYDVPMDTRVSLTDASHVNAYPIVGFTWIIVYKTHPDRSIEQSQRLKDLLSWVVNDGQAMAEDLHYASLPKNIATRLSGIINSIQ